MAIWKHWTHIARWMIRLNKEPSRWHDLLIYGIWAWELPEDQVVDQHGKFPPENARYIHNFSGNGEETFEDMNPAWVAEMKSRGATHITINRGKTCDIRQIEDVMQGLGL